MYMHIINQDDNNNNITVSWRCLHHQVPPPSAAAQRSIPQGVSFICLQCHNNTSIFTIRLSHQNNPRDLQVSVTASRGRGEPTKWQLVQRVCEMKLSAEEKNNFTNNRLINVDFAHPGCSVTWCIRTTILTLFFSLQTFIPSGVPMPQQRLGCV